MSNNYLASGHFVLLKKKKYEDDKTKITDPSYKYEIISIGDKATDILLEGDIIKFEQGALKLIEEDIYCIDEEAIYCVIKNKND